MSRSFEIVASAILGAFVAGQITFYPLLLHFNKVYVAQIAATGELSPMRINIQMHALWLGSVGLGAVAGALWKKWWLGKPRRF